MARETAIFIATGAPGTGKTTQTKKELMQYCLDDKATGRTSRKVLILDTNNEYTEFKTVHYDPEDKTDNGKNFELLINPEIRRVSNVTPKGRFLTFKQKQKVAIDITQKYRNGAVLLEDLNTYIVGIHKSEDLVSALCSARHKGIDLIIHVQNLSAIEPRMWNNVTFIRFHYQTGNIRNDYKITNYEFMRIVQFMVSKVYFSCRCSEDKCKCGAKYFFVYANVRTNKISGTEKTKSLYLDAVRMFKEQHKNISDAIAQDEMCYFSIV